MSIKQQAGYPDKTPAANPPIEVDGYESMSVKTRPPAAAKALVGATSLPEIADACDQRRAHSNALSDPSRKGFEKQSPNS
jgi:hypothetical protein